MCTVKSQVTLVRMAYPLLVALFALPLGLPAATPATPPGPLALGGSLRPVKGGTAIYLVQLKQAGAASYKGETAGYAPTKPQSGSKLDRSSGQVVSYVKYLEDAHQRLLADIGASDSKLYSYRYVFNGFAVQLAPEQLSKLARRDEVERIWLDTEQQVHTNNSAVFLGLLNQEGGLRADLGLRGEDIVIGVIDSGIAPNHPSLQDFEEDIPRTCETEWARSSWLGRWLCHSFRSNPATTQLYDPPIGFTGSCEEGEGFSIDHCNNKLVGARYYLDGFLFSNDLDAGEFVSPKDADGHGTHIATTLAGNLVSAHLFGTRIGDISGIAPRARVAIYKACWLKPGESRATCSTSDLARAIDDAVADGVDIINYSVGSLETDLTAPDDFALLNAVDAGVLSVVAAGNDGPSLGTIGSPSSAPWVLTVAASTQSGPRLEDAIEITAPSELVGPLEVREASFTRPLIDLGTVDGSLVLVDDGQDVIAGGALGSVRDGCEALLNADQLVDNIALIERGGCEFQNKLERVEQAGAIAAIVYNDTGSPIVMDGDIGSVDIPAMMISTANGQRLVDRLSAGTEIQISLEKGVFIERRDIGNQMSDFSSRGPALSEQDFLKPDLTAPGVNIFAGHTPDIANGISGELFQYLSGTSQSTPEIAGIAALLKEAHPEWSPGTIKSALMTSAYQRVSKPDSETAADPFDMGAGHIDANRALDPGLVYDTGFLDHAAFMCGLDQPPFPASDCEILARAGFPFAPRDLNLPSIGIGELISGDVVSRRVTNVGPAGVYQVSVDAPTGVGIVVDPPTLNLGSGESGDYALSFQVGATTLEAWSFGRINWSDGTHDVGSPVAVRPVIMRAPEEISLEGANGTGILAADFGYSGEYFAAVHGLNEPFFIAADAFVEDDASNNFTFRFDQGVNGHFFNVEPGDLYLRVSLFDELTDGDDDLDLYLFFCPTVDNCTQVGQSGSFTAAEQIDLLRPPPGLYAALVHGFETDQVSGGAGAVYDLLAWSFAFEEAGNFEIQAPVTVANGDRLDLPFAWNSLNPGTRYLGAVSHDTPFGQFFLTIINANAR